MELIYSKKNGSPGDILSRSRVLVVGISVMGLIAAFLLRSYIHLEDSHGSAPSSPSAQSSSLAVLSPVQNEIERPLATDESNNCSGEGECYQITGVITDSVTGDPLPNAEVVARQQDCAPNTICFGYAFSTASENGSYVLSLKAGRNWSIRAQECDHGSSEQLVYVEQDEAVDFALDASSVEGNEETCQSGAFIIAVAIVAIVFVIMVSIMVIVFVLSLVGNETLAPALTEDDLGVDIDRDGLLSPGNQRRL